MPDSDDGAELAEGASHWLFDCQECSFTSVEDSEPEALEAADAHCDYGPGHFDFEILSPDGEVVYP